MRLGLLLLNLIQLALFNSKITHAVRIELKPSGVSRFKMPELGAESRLYADKGYISKALSEDLKEDGITLITTHRKNMKPKVLAAWDRAMLSKRFIIETINDQLKNISQIEHSRHRSLHGFMLNLLGGLIAYCLKPEKPSLNITNTEKSGLMAMA